ncbi:FAD-binding domain-containing protein [Gigaspora margarita]|uniref:FAD-binding domain-containing protein n=1 Tax=Gigaspora margarita TaxID=4874 RepID=A0A8H4ALD3_GIGMA|nr:FAD-binding domain-containing protein [Gigaspora margarita]
MISHLYILFFFFVTIRASSYLHPVIKCPEEDSIRKCLDQYHIKGPVNFRNNTVAYNKDLNFEYNLRVIHFPVAFVHPIDVFDVQNAIKCAVKLNFPIVARSGGHSYEGYGLGDKDCSLVVDLETLNKIIIDIASQTAIVETGNKLESLYYETNRHGFAFPAGVCPYVGVGGHITGGGVGHLNRIFGLSSDNVLDAQIVLANGTIINSAKKYPELFWAIRGAGNAGYGIITTLTLRIYPIQKIATRVALLYDFDQTPLVISVMNQLGGNLHRNLTVLIRISSDAPTTVEGIYLGSANESQPYLQEFIKLSKPKSITYFENDLYSILTEGKESTKTPGFYKVKSFFIDSTGLSYEGIKYFMSFTKSIKCAVNNHVMLLNGGKVNDIRRNETAFIHRDN